MDVNDFLKYNPKLVFGLIHVNENLLDEYIKKISDDISLLKILFSEAYEYLYMNPEQIVHLIHDKNLSNTLISKFNKWKEYLDQHIDDDHDNTGLCFINVIFYLPIKHTDNMITFQLYINIDGSFPELFKGILMYYPGDKDQKRIEVFQPIYDHDPRWNKEIVSFTMKKDSILELEVKKSLRSKSFDIMYIPIQSKPTYILKWGIIP